MDYMPLRPEWLSDCDEIIHDITSQDKGFVNPEAYVSRKSVADLIVKLATTPGLDVEESLGI